ncbi:maltooligosyl trehalose synthase [Thermomonospora echinospora]|uniref:Maltooligosyl trehalose synthase n=1 Tax=Thermomonospora echinospora TaxID=1992 RepID=A0A1H6DZR6_9ACTN|nr:malto-oligosyltrehalose synthase [Thermomonospora echinospora]SEG90807.1 maltooligosyl trehalose synthase [Thermomonospora echinospora]
MSDATEATEATDVTEGTAAPHATYRLQLRAEFGFADAAALAGYLAALGVSHVYLSPILQAAPGSAHGYDVVDHTRISDALGGEEGFRAMAARLREAGLRLVVDIVPNHMAIPAPESLNRPLWSVLEQGRASPYARWFDIDWEYGDGRVLLPVLGAEDVGDELVADGGVLRYHDHVFPLPDDHYRPVYWREGPNYRRFFEISTLAGLRAEDPEVFDRTHELIRKLVDEGLIDGLRVDHPDGLTAPRAYLRRLAEETGGRWTVVEKILTGPEELAPDWPCAGTTGYDALNMVGGVFVDPAGERPLTEAYVTFTGGSADFEEVAYRAKRQMAERGLRPEVLRLHRALCRVLPSHDPGEMLAALVELLVAMPVYRTYVEPGEEELPHTRRVMAQAAEAARRRLPERLHPALETILPVVSGGLGCTDETTEVAVRFQQTAAPLMAKGVEDTAFYRWSRLVARNEVGGEPDRFAVSPTEFHEFCARLARDWPSTMTTLSTHDTKRQEDVRARLAVLAELPGEWAAAVRGWRSPDSPLEPDLEYLLWQTVVGAWPLTRERLAEYLTKAMREAKTRTSWTDPDPAYEEAVLAYVGDLPAEEVAAFTTGLELYTRANILGQKLVQLAMPGVPDVYQGCELVGLSLVDPDNRRPVDYDDRRARLARLDAGEPPRDLDDEKLLVTSRTLRLRRDRPEWFGPGRYEPVEAAGPAAGHVLAFRRGGVVAAATRLPVGLERRGGWADTRLSLGDGPWRDVLTGVVHDDLRLDRLLRVLPVALLVRHEEGA